MECKYSCDYESALARSNRTFIYSGTRESRHIRLGIVEDYSEGQKKKVLLAASLLTPAHLYIWDEPLNYIDVFSRIQIEKLLLEYKPTMLFVEHDIKFREKIATEIIEL